MNDEPAAIQVRELRLIEPRPGVSRREEWDMGEFGTRKVVIFRDPDGTFLELIQRPPYPGELE